MLSRFAWPKAGVPVCSRTRERVLVLTDLKTLEHLSHRDTAPVTLSCTAMAARAPGRGLTLLLALVLGVLSVAKGQGYSKAAFRNV